MRGPSFRAGLLAALTLLLNESASPAAAPTIDATVAALYVGQSVAIEGMVTATGREGNVVRLRLGTPPQQVVVALIEGLLSNFPPAPEQYYAGKNVRVAGTLQEFRGIMEIRVLAVSEIQVVELGQPAAVVAPPIVGGSAPVNVPPQHVQPLAERNQQLEAPRTVAQPTLTPPQEVPTLPPPATATEPLSPTATSIPSPTPLSVVVMPPEQTSIPPSTLEGLEERLKKMEIRVRHLERALDKDP